MKAFYLLILLPFLLYSQDKMPDKVTLDASSTVYVVADIIYFSINLQVEEPDPQIAFDNHKKLETRLIKLLKDFPIPDSLIQYSLLSVNATNPRSEEKKFFTHQQVKVKLTDLSLYNSFQIKLLQSGIYEFRAGFGSSQVEKARSEGYQAAIDNAKRDAEIIAKTLGKRLGDILEISSHTNEFRQLDTSTALSIPSVSSLIEIGQKVAARTNIKITFALL